MRRTWAWMLATVAFAGCGVTTDGAMDELALQTPEMLPKAPVKPVALSATPGRVVVDGVSPGTLTPLAERDYRANGGPVEVDLRRGDAGPAFSELCAGQVDLVDSSRPISRAELAACRDAGLTPVQFHIAADAVVIATKSEIDVGADCATIGQVREMYRAGSPVYDWSQLDFAEAPLRVAGPEPDSNVFRLFGQAVLGAEEPSLIDLRSDYRAADDRERRHFVVGSAADASLAAKRPILAARLRDLRGDAGRAHRSLRAAESELREARRQVTKGVADGRGLEAQARDSARVVGAEKAVGRSRRWVTRAERDLDAARADVAAAVRAARRVGVLRGRVGQFRFSYYELFEDQLRPLEIDAGGAGGRSCVFPSQQTITDGSYPLSRQLLITSTTAGLRREEVRSFLGSYLARAQRLAVDYRLVPLPDATVRAERAWVAGTENPTVVTEPAGEVR